MVRWFRKYLHVSISFPDMITSMHFAGMINDLTSTVLFLGALKMDKFVCSNSIFYRVRFNFVPSFSIMLWLRAKFSALYPEASRFVFVLHTPQLTCLSCIISQRSNCFNTNYRMQRGSRQAPRSSLSEALHRWIYFLKASPVIGLLSIFSLQEQFSNLTMNFRQRLFRNVSHMNQEQKQAKQVRIRSLKNNYQEQRGPAFIHPFTTQVQSPVRKVKHYSEKENDPNSNLDLLINSCDSKSLDFSYSPSSCKKPRFQQQIFVPAHQQSKKLLRPKQAAASKLYVSQKVKAIINIYAEKQPKLKLNTLVKPTRCISPPKRLR